MSLLRAACDAPAPSNEMGVLRVRTSFAGIRERGALLQTAASMSRARDHVVLLASAPHEAFEQHSDSCASLARARAIPLVPSIPCPLRQSSQATVLGSFRPLFRGPGQNDVAETTQSSASFASLLKTELSCNRFHDRARTRVRGATLRKRAVAMYTCIFVTHGGRRCT